MVRFIYQNIISEITNVSNWRVSGGEDMNIGGKWMRKVIPTLTIVILIVLASLQTISSQETDVNAGDTSVQQPCDNVTQHLESVGVISGNYINIKRWEKTLDFGGVPVKFVRLKNETMDEGYYVNCISGEVYTFDELPGYQLSDPVLSKIDQQIRFEAKIRPNESKFGIVVGYFTPTDEKKEILESLGMEMDERANEFSYNLSLELGSGYYNNLQGYTTYDSILSIAELDFVDRITLNELMYNVTAGVITGAGASTTPSHQEPPVSTPQVTLIANSIDYPLAKDFIAFLQNKSMEVVHVNASDFDQHNSDEFIVILGGPDAPEGVGEIVQDVLNSAEEDFVRVPGSSRMFIIKGIWAERQTIFIIAGSDRYQTKLASSETQETVKGVVWDA